MGWGLFLYLLVLSKDIFQKAARDLCGLSIYLDGICKEKERTLHQKETTGTFI
jgi:hypothetical protein